jgi:hypothetical protein
MEAENETPERRRLERFFLCAPARVLLPSRDRNRKEYNLTTRDLSSDGAFLYSSQPIPEGVKVDTELLIFPETLQKLAGGSGRVRVRVKGKVIRSDSKGIAVRFESGFKITALDTK